ncbi:MAG: protein kinase [Bryobacteraceae bacterium]|nr:protein kinase [Bryobacteraceae bacterium]
MTGRTIAHYQILEKLGEGGMGVVFKARDTHLDRFVAIKVLPPERVADPSRKARFVQEAKAASALNHPNILHVYDIGESAGTDFIAMEYVDGKTLGQLIGRKGLKLGDALKYSAQIAAGLAKAHAAGIVHRDLKPANVMVSSDGVVKLLDFGLAKLTEPGGSDSEAPTWTMKPHTEEGTIVGTVAYMSPEQAEGKPVDARSDIFSFGSLLYEMVTGRRAFQGESKLATLSAILRYEPAPVSTLVEEMPPELEKLIQRCLRKDPARRFQHMDDVRIALEDLKEESDSGKLAAPARAATRSRRAWLVLTAGIVALAAIAIAVAVIWKLTHSPAAPAAPALTRLTSDSGLTTDPALSPDGKLLAYASDRAGEGNLDIWVKQVGGGEPLRLTLDPADEREPDFSPDGTKVLFRSSREGGGIYLVSTLGGPARRIASGGRRPRFSPDGMWIAYGSAGDAVVGFDTRWSYRTYIVPSTGGTARQIQPDFAGVGYPVWTREGQHLLFLGIRDEKLPKEGNLDWWVTSLASGLAVKTGVLEATKDKNLISTLQAYPWALVPSAYEPDGKGVIFSARSGDSVNLWRIGISPDNWKVSGAPQRLTSGSTLEENPSVAWKSGGGVSVAFASLSSNIDIWSLPLQPNQGRVAGEPHRLTRDAAADFHPALSPDGRKMVFISSRTGGEEIWIKDLQSGEESALTVSRSNKWMPRFSRDGSKVSFTAYESRKWNGYVMPSTGGAQEVFCEDCGEATDWTPDGKHIIGNTVTGRVWMVEVASRRMTELFAQPGRWLATGRLSADGRWITLLDGRSRHSYLAPFQRERPIQESTLIATARGQLLYWSPDDTFVYGRSELCEGHRCLWAQRLDPTSKRPIGQPIAIYHSHNARLSLANDPLNHPFVGSDRIVFGMGERTGNIWMAEFR